jgi:hypothetical protein
VTADYGSEADQRRKSIDNARAELARAGYGLFELAHGAYLIARCDCTRPCADLAAVRAFVAQIGGAA